VTSAIPGREERTRHLILDAAAPLLARDPEASMSQIADAARVGRATLYRHYDGRDDLIQDLVRRALAEAEAALVDAHLNGVGVEEALRRVFRVLVHIGHRFVVVLRENRGDRTPDNPMYATVGRHLTDLIERGRSEGVLRSDDPGEWVLHMLGATLDVACELAQDVGPEDAAAFAARHFLDGTRARDPGVSPPPA